MNRENVKIVDSPDSDVPCPTCGGETNKVNSPSRPWLDPPPNAEWLASALGLVHCESCNESYSWGVRAM